MSVKSKGRRLGRMVRRVTGIPLPVAMSIGKRVAQGKGDYELIEKFPQYFSKESRGCTCCGPETTLKGPRGSIVGYAFGEHTIVKEYDLTEKLKKVPFGTAVSVG
jgi:hypothetical protein